MLCACPCLVIRLANAMQGLEGARPPKRGTVFATKAAAGSSVAAGP
jgi:hypothetical protein